MIIPFMKMHGIGNDFILINKDEINDAVNMTDLAVSVCHRKFGVGADGLMVKKTSFEADAKMLYYNSDGSQGEMCGNGIRCFARFIDDLRSHHSRTLTVETLAGMKTLTITTTNQVQSEVEVNMGTPDFHTLQGTLTVMGHDLEYSFVTVGVPHAVIFIDKPVADQVDSMGPVIENHPLFPKRTNVNFCYIENRGKMHVFTWERGAGHTLACGTGVTSAFAVAAKMKRMNKNVVVQAEGGLLQMQLLDDGTINMTGPARDVCSGSFFYEKP